MVWTVVGNLVTVSLIVSTPISQLIHKLEDRGVVGILNAATNLLLLIIKSTFTSLHRVL